MKKLLSIVCCWLLCQLAYGASCELNPLIPPQKDSQRLASGLVGEWDNSFNQIMMTISDIDGNHWNYAAIENKPVSPRGLLLFIHGFPEFSWAWEKQLQYFGDEYHAVAIDLKGHHYSSSPDAVEEYDFIELGWELREIINCLGYDSATLVGHDFGGAIAWIMGMLHPDIVNGLAIVNAPHPYLFGRALLDPNSDQSSRSYYIDLARGETLRDSIRFTTTIFSDFSIFESGFYAGKRFFRLVFENWLPTSRWRMMKHYYRALPYPANEQDYPESLTDFQKKIYTVKRPVILFWGMQDPYFTPETLVGIDELVPDLRLHTYDEGTHWLHHEAQDLNEKIDGFLQELQN